jgi:hypothetical protein
MFKFIGIAVMAMLLAACATGAGSAYSGSNGKTLIVEKNVWDDYQKYLSYLNGSNPGTFIVVIVDDHAVGSGYRVCPAGHCQADANISSAMAQCHAKGLNCAVFAQSNDIMLNYKLDN